jgi:hypothetical protein
MSHGCPLPFLTSYRWGMNMNVSDHIERASPFLQGGVKRSIPVTGP